MAESDAVRLKPRAVAAPLGVLPPPIIAVATAVRSQSSVTPGDGKPAE
jgi:hypothetical protein